MKIRGFNWPLWSGFLLSLIAFLSYPFVFVWFAVTRDFPWASLLLFALAGVLVIVGVRRAFVPDRPRPKLSKTVGVGVAVLSVAILGFFIFSTLIMARWLPASRGAPQVGHKAPDFTLPDTNGRSVALTELLSAPINGKAPKGVLVIFYRGYW